MADITWPVTLPAPIQDSFVDKFPDGLIETQMDAGPGKVRRRYTAAVEDISVSYQLNATQRGTFRTFFMTTSKMGSLRFNWTHPETGATVEARFVKGALPSMADLASNGIVSMVIRVLP